MKIFSLSASDDYFGLRQKTKNTNPSSPLLWFKEKKSVAATWSPVEVTVHWHGYYDKKKKLLPADFPSHSLGSLIMTGHAANLLRDYLAPYGELLPLKCDEGEFWVLNVLKGVDALDAARSRPLYPDYEDDPPCLPIGEQAGISTPYAFFTEGLESIDLFHVPELALFFMTENFIKKVENLGLTGLKVRREFDSEADQYGFDYQGNSLSTPRS